MTEDEKAIMRMLMVQNRRLYDLERRRSWLSDLSSNIAGNAIFDGAVWLFSKILRKL